MARPVRWFAQIGLVGAVRDPSRDPFWPPAAATVKRASRILRAMVLLRDKGTCRYCGRPATHVDHVVPVARGGPTHESNLVAACERCNLEKGSRGVGADLKGVA